MGQAHLGPLDLTITGLAAQMRGDLVDARDAGGRDGMTFGLEAARHVDRRAAVAPWCARVEEVGRTARLAQTEVVVVQQLGRSEAVVQLDEVEVGGADARHLVRLAGCVAGARIDIGEHVAAVDIGIGGEHRRRDLDRALLHVERQGTQLRFAHQHRGRRAIGVG